MDSRQFRFNIENIIFSVEALIEVGQTGCKVIFERVEIVNTGQGNNGKVTGGRLRELNFMLENFSNKHINVVVKAIRQDIANKVKLLIGNGQFDCRSYSPSKLFIQR